MEYMQSYLTGEFMVTFVRVDLSISLLSKVPAYQQLAQRVIDAIESGELQVGDKMPSYKELMEQSGLSMPTVQKAVKKLEREHYVFAVSGRGTYVTSRT